VKTIRFKSMHLGKEDYERERVRQFAGDVKRVMVLTMLADDVIEEEEVEVIQQFYRRLGEDELTEEQILHEAEQARRAGTSAALYARGHRGSPDRSRRKRGSFGVPLPSRRRMVNLSEERLRKNSWNSPRPSGSRKSRFRDIMMSWLLASALSQLDGFVHLPDS
jgi:hypothetical protein